MFGFTYICEKELSSMILGLGDTHVHGARKRYTEMKISTSRKQEMSFLNKLLVLDYEVWFIPKPDCLCIQMV